MTTKAKTTRRPPVPKDIKAAHGLLDELMILREDMKDMRKAADASNRDMAKLVREVAALKARLKPKAPPKKGAR